MYSSSVTDAEWATLEPLLPAPGSTAGRGGRPEKYCRRAMVDAILYIVRGGTAWRQLPVEFPPAGTMYAVFARWAHSGAWQRILDALRDRLRVRAGRDRCPTAAIIDSQTVPAADTVLRSSRGWDGGKRTNGVKRHIAVDVNGLLLAVVVTAASIQDRDTAHRLLPHCAAGSPPSGWSGPTAVIPDVCLSGRKMFSPLLYRSSNASPAPPVSTPVPALGWSREISRGSTSIAAACATTKPDPTTTKPWFTSR
ncbi:IS5 family transposase [Rhodococcus sp. NPDC059968]|uniref:IS5 family transposase n=1 Tax=Rhodococcus sp. NPDC059968 TaxID=3347017 RepID=UPI00366FE2F6